MGGGDHRGDSARGGTDTGAPGAGAPGAGSAPVHGQYAKTPAQRARIVDAATEVFAQRGPRGASLREIADAVGMSQAGLLHHFGSKHGLLLAVLDRFECEDQPPEPLTSVAEGVAFVRGELARGALAPGRFQLQLALAAEAAEPDHPARQFFADRYRRVTNQFEELLATAVAAGSLQADTDTRAVAQLLIAAMDGLQLQRQHDPEVDVVGAFDVLVAALTRAIGDGDWE